MARRRDGWSFLVVDSEDLQKLNRLTVDGETVLVRIANEFVDVSALSWAYDVATQYAPQAIVAHDYLIRAFFDRDGDIERAASNEAGFPSSLEPFLRSMGT